MPHAQRRGVEIFGIRNLGGDPRITAKKGSRSYFLT